MIKNIKQWILYLGIVIILIIAFTTLLYRQQLIAIKDNELVKRYDSMAVPLKKIGIFMSHLSTPAPNEIVSGAKHESEILDYNLEVYNSNGDVHKQSKQIEEAIKNGINGLLIESGCVKTSMRAIKMANEAHIPIVTINQKILDVDNQNAFVGSDSEDMGRDLMNKVAEDLKGRGNLGILLGPLGCDAQVCRSKGFDLILMDYPDLKIVNQDVGDWHSANAEKIVNNWLDNKNISLNAIVAQNDDMALAAIKVLKERGISPKKIMVYGIDGTDKALDAIKKGDLKATVFHNSFQEGEDAVKIISEIMHKRNVPKKSIVDYVLVTKENVNTIENRNRELERIYKN